jgi:hypothetical protein
MLSPHRWPLVALLVALLIGKSREKKGFDNIIAFLVDKRKKEKTSKTIVITMNFRSLFGGDDQI